MHPLPDLRAGDFGGGRILHQIVNANCAVAAEPGLEVSQAHINVLAQPGFRLRSWHRGHIQQLGASDLDVIPPDIKLIGTVTELSVEDLLADWYEIGMCDPGVVKPIAGLTLRVLAHHGEGALVNLCVQSV